MRVYFLVGADVEVDKDYEGNKDLEIKRLGHEAIEGTRVGGGYSSIEKVRVIRRVDAKGNRFKKV